MNADLIAGVCGLHDSDDCAPNQHDHGQACGVCMAGCLTDVW